MSIVATIILLGIGLIWAAETGSTASHLSLALSLLFPVGLAVVAWSALPLEQSDRAAGLATLALALALIGYLAIGFGFHFGGAAFVSNNEELKNLSRFFSLVRGENSASWGFVGLEGFFLGGDTATPAALQLFISQLPLVAATVLIVMLGMPRKIPLMAVALTGLIVSAVTFPLAGHWISGGGWLAQLGGTFSLGHGVVDFNGAGMVFVVGGATVLVAALAFGRKRPLVSDTSTNGASLARSEMPETRFPILAGLGALMAAVGWIGLGLANPLYAEASNVLNWPQITLNGLVGLAGGTLVAQLYSWFTTGRFDVLMGPRGALAGLIAVSAGAPFYPTWAALIIGAIAGLLLPLAIWIVERFLQLDDATAAIAGYLLPGVWGLLAVGIFADGRWGQGWNGVDGFPGQGISGLTVAPGLQADAGQLAAQFWGVVALLALGCLLPWGVFRIVAWLSRLRLARKNQAHRLKLSTARPGNPNPNKPSQSTAGDLDRVVSAKERR
jgi:Amt family ammonium transporter